MWSYLFSAAVASCVYFSYTLQWPTDKLHIVEGIKFSTYSNVDWLIEFRGSVGRILKHNL
jgi:hypothetical protein